MTDFSTNWEHLTDPMKKLVIGWLDYESRCSLRTCSKSEKSIVDSTEFRASVVRMTETDCHDRDKTIIRVDVDTFSIWFVGKNELTRVERGWKGEVVQELSELKQENRHELAKKFLDLFFRKWNVSTDLFHVEGMNIEPQDDWLFKCSSVNLCNISRGNIYMWLENMIPQPKYKNIVFHGMYYADFGLKLPVPSKVLNVTQRLRVEFCLLITDEQFDAIEAMDLNVRVVNVSMESIKRKLRKFLEHGKVDQKLNIVALCSQRLDVKYLLPEGVELKIMKSQGETETYDLNLKFRNVHGVQATRVLYINNLLYKTIDCYVKDKCDCKTWD